MTHPPPEQKMMLKELNNLRKRRFYTLCVTITIPVIVIFSIVDYLEGDTFELLVDIVIGIILIFSLFLLQTKNVDQLVYRLGLFLVGLSFLYGISIGSGGGTMLYWSFVLPLIFLFFLEKIEGLLWSLGFTFLLGIIMINPFSASVFPYTPYITLRFLGAFLFVILIAYGLESSRHQYSELSIRQQNQLREEKVRLEAALAEVKTLSGLLPICANCKKIRDDDGYWQDVAVYIRNHSDADFSHGICPDCYEIFYGNLKNLKPNENG